MKKIFILLIIGFVSIQSYGQSLDKLFSEFSKAENAENVSIGKFGWSFFKLATIGNKDAGIMKKIKSLHVLDLSDCSSSVKIKFAGEMDRLKDKDYELLLMTKDDEDEDLILGNMKNDIIKEVIIIDKTDPTIVRIKGKFKMSDLTDIKNLKNTSI